MSYYITHLTNVNGVQELYNVIIDFMTNTLGWTVKQTGTFSGYGRDYTILYSEGESTQEDIYIGLNWYYRSTERCGIQLNAYTGYDSDYGYDNLGRLSTTKSNGVYRYLPTVHLQNTNYDHVWLCGDKDCCFGVVRCVSIYPHFYIGLLRRYWSRYFDPYPLYVFGTFDGSDYPSSRSWNSSFRGISARRVGGDCLWYDFDTWHWGFRYDPRDGYHDYALDSKKIFTANMFIHCLTFPGDKRAVAPFLISDETGMRGEIKWVYKLSRATQLDPEDEVNIDSAVYKVFPGTIDLNVLLWFAIRVA